MRKIPTSNECGHPLNLSISLSGGKEINRDSPSSGERTGKTQSPQLNLERKRKKGEGGAIFLRFFSILNFSQRCSLEGNSSFFFQRNQKLFLSWNSSMCIIGPVKRVLLGTAKEGESPVFEFQFFERRS